MGQCMEETTSGAKIHPFLGPLTHHHNQNRDYFLLKLAISNEEEYIEWSKKINKLRYHPDVKEYLYTPLREQFKTPKSFCQGSNYLELLLEPYDETLAEMQSMNIQKNRYPSQALLWKVLVVLVKYIKYMSSKHKEIQSFQLQNLLSWSSGKIKMIPAEMTSNLIIRPEYDIQIDDNAEKLENNSWVKEHVNPIYQAGMICLCLADLLSPGKYFDERKKRWRDLQEKVKNESLKNIEIRYSIFFTDTLRSMLDTIHQGEISLETLSIKLQTFESELLLKRQLESMIGMTISLNTPMKNSNILDTKINNNSNLLKLSQMKYDLTDKASTNLQLQDEVQEENDARSLQIL